MRLVHYFGLLLLFTSLGKLSFAQTTAADDCASAIYLTIQDEFCAGQEFESDNHTLSGGDPVPSCWDAPPQNTMWFRFIPDSTSVAISTNFSSDVSETQIAVYSGSCGSLTEIGCEDDISQTNFKSRVQVNNLIPGATYYIMVDTEGENGSYFICVQNKIAPGDPDEIQDCPTGRFICSKDPIFMPNGSGNKGLINENASCFGSTGERSSHWFRFYVTQTGSLGFTISPNSNIDYDFALFDITDSPRDASFCDLENEVVCNYSNYPGAGDPSTGLGCTNNNPPSDPPCEAMETVYSGRTYALLVNRYSEESTSGYDLTWDGTSIFGVPSIDFSYNLSCAGEATNFKFLNQGSYDITWEFGDGTTSNEENPNHIYTAPGNYLVKVYANTLPGNCSSYSEKVVTVGQPNATLSPMDPTICKGTSIEVTANPDLFPASAYLTYHDNDQVAPLIDNGVAANWDGTSGSFTSKAIAVNDLNPASWDVEKICINISHPYVEDLIVYLETPCGDYPLMIDRSGGATKNFYNTCFSKSATTGMTIDAGTAPYSGTFVPEENSLFWSKISACNNPNGTWYLHIGDSKGGDKGVFYSWNIEFSSENGIRSFSWSPNIEITDEGTLSPIFTATNNRTYQFGITDHIGCTNTVPIDVTVIEGADAGGDNTVYFCERTEEISLFPLLTGSPDNFGTWADLDGSGGLNTNKVQLAGLDGTYRFEYTVAGSSGCPDDKAIVTLVVEQLAGVGQDSSIIVCKEDQTLALFDYLGGDADAGGTWSGSGFGTLNSTTGDWDITSSLAAGTYEFHYTVAAGVICPAQTSTISVQISSLPEPKSTSICHNETNFDLYGSLNNPDNISGVWNEQTTSGAIVNGQFFNATGYSGIQNFTFIATEFDACPFNTETSVTIRILDTLKTGIPYYSCSSDDAFYTAFVPIEGGKPDYTTSSGTINGSLPYVATTAQFPSNTNQTVTIDDALGCGPITVDLFADCDCDTDAGIMLDRSDTLRLCNSGTFTPRWDSAFVNDGDDNLVFVLHESPFPYLQNIKATSNNGTFGFQAGMEYNKVYYISAVAGNKNGPNAVDYFDPCLSVALGQPVEWRLDPLIEYTVAPSICQGSGGEINYELVQGSGPFKIALIGNGLADTITLLQDSGNFLVSPSITTDFTINYIEDIAGCSSTQNDPTQNMEVIPNVRGDLDFFAGKCSDDAPHQVKVHLEGKGPSFDITLSNGSGLETFSNVDSGDVLTVSPLGLPANYTIDTLIDLGGNQCPLFLSGDASFFPTPQGTFSIPPVFCEGEKISIQGAISNSLNYFVQIETAQFGSSKVYGDQTDFSTELNPLSAGTHWVNISTIEDTISGCVKDLDTTINVTVNPSPKVDLSGNATVCFEPGIEGEVFMSNLVGVPPFKAYFSSSHHGNFEITFSNDTSFLRELFVENQNQTPNYFVLDSIEDQDNGCVGKWNDTITLLVNPIPTYTLIADKYDICAGETVNLELFGNGAGNLRANLLGKNANSDIVHDDIFFIPDETTITIPYTLDETMTFIVAQFEDQNTPVCANTEMDSIVINVYEHPTLNLSFVGGVSDICLGDSVGIEISYSGTSPLVFDAVVDGTEVLTGVGPSAFPHILNLDPNAFSVGENRVYLNNIVDQTPASCPGSSPDTLNFTIWDNPQVLLERISPFDRVCEGDAMEFQLRHLRGTLPLEVTGSISGTATTWSMADSLLPISITPTNSGTIQLDNVIGGGPASCLTRTNQSFSYDIKALPSIALDGSIPICEEGEARLPFELFGEGSITVYFSTNTDSSFSIQRTMGEHELPFQPNDDGNIVIQVDSIVDGGNPNCWNYVNPSATLEVYPTPEPNFSGLEIADCPPANILITNTTSDTYRNGGSSMWSIADSVFEYNGDTVHFFLSKSGYYDVTLTQTSAQGCTGTTLKREFIHVYPNPKADFAYSPAEPTIETPLVDFINQSNGGDYFYWSLDGEIVANVSDPYIEFPSDTAGIYTVCLEALNEMGCRNSYCERIELTEKLLIYIPNAFSPDDNGINDVFLPIINGVRSDVKGYELLIFDGWGNTIFESKDPEQGWDGTDGKGNKVKMGVYTFVLTAYPKNSTEVQRVDGVVHLLR